MNLTPAARPARCHCRIELVLYLDGQHPQTCPDLAQRKVPRTRFEVPAHQIGGVVMPAASLRSLDLARRWCDVSAGDYKMVTRLWPGLCLAVLIWPTTLKPDSDWTWWLITVGADGVRDTAGPDAMGAAADLTAAITDAEKALADLPTRVSA